SLHRTHSQRREACRPPGRAVRKSRADRQPQNRQGARHHCPAAPVRPRRRGDRVRRREFIALLGGAEEEVMSSKAAILRGRLVSRRSFVMTLAAAAAARAAQAQAPAPGTSAAPAGGPKGREQRMLIVDAQIHIWKSSKPNPNHRQIADYSADDALKEMDEAGVTAAVIHPPGWDPNANALAVEAARQHP